MTGGQLVSTGEARFEPGGTKGAFYPPAEEKLRADISVPGSTLKLTETPYELSLDSIHPCKQKSHHYDFNIRP